VEGKGLRDRAPDIQNLGAEIVGASFDAPEKNLAFVEKYDFPFRILSDVDKKVGELYETKRHPDEADPNRAKRRTYLIDPQGKIRKAYRVRDIPAHPGEVLEDLRTLTAR
jgi:peroxiredoxin Q/BCP